MKFNKLLWAVVAGTALFAGTTTELMAQGRGNSDKDRGGRRGGDRSLRSSSGRSSIAGPSLRSDRGSSRSSRSIERPQSRDFSIPRGSSISRGSSPSREFLSPRSPSQSNRSPARGRPSVSGSFPSIRGGSRAEPAAPSSRPSAGIRSSAGSPFGGRASEGISGRSPSSTPPRAAVPSQSARSLAPQLRSTPQWRSSRPNLDSGIGRGSQLGDAIRSRAYGAGSDARGRTDRPSISRDLDAIGSLRSEVRPGSGPRLDRSVPSSRVPQTDRSDRFDVGRSSRDFLDSAIGRSARGDGDRVGFGRPSPLDLIPGEMSRPGRPASIGGRGGNRIDLGDTSLSINQFSNAVNRYSGYGYGGRSRSGGYGGWGGVGLGFGLGVVASNWNRYWYDTYLPHYHRSWYRGCWGWNRGVDYVPWVYSYSNWGYSPLPYRLGYVRYVNPYYIHTTTVVYDYRQPIIIEQPGAVGDPDQRALDLLDDALQAFLAMDYERALRQLDESLQINPHDPAAHELRALALFATGRYTDAAATLHSLLAAAPGWDWATMRSLYPSNAVYTDQLRALEAYRNRNPLSADGRFVLAYHYLVAGHTEAAQHELERVVELEPRDQVAAQILDGLRAETAPRTDDGRVFSQPFEEGDASSSATLPPPASPETLPVPDGDAEEADLPLVTLPGIWRAVPEQDTTVELVLSEESRFTWTTIRDAETEMIEGKYSVNGPLLILEASEGEAILARLVPETATRFRFVVLGGPQDDPGLLFNRQL